MDVKELNKSQLILLAILLSFVVSIATGITTVTLLEKAPRTITVPIDRIVQNTVEKLVPVETKSEALSEDQKSLLEQLKAIKPLTITLFAKGAKADGSEDKILGTGLFLGDNKVVIASVIKEPKDGEIYVVKSILGEQKISKLTQEKDFTIIELAKVDVPVEVPKKEEPKEEPKTETPPVVPSTP